MSRVLVIVFVLSVFSGLRAQELFIQTEPASNMPVGRFGVRATSDIWSENNRTISRFGTEIMYGVSKNLMVHLQAYGSNAIHNFEPETYGIYAKYRLYSDDDFKYHFRISAYGEVLGGKQHNTIPSFSFKGAGPMVASGLIFTLLENRLALSSTVGAAKSLKDIFPTDGGSFTNITGINASLSAGYLVYPNTYTSYSDPNINIYAELLGYNSYFQLNDGFDYSTNASGGELVLSFGPQLILNSVARFDLAYSLLLKSNFIEKRSNSLLLRFEYNFY